ncbi:MAG: histidine kinase [Rhizobacter sp.]|nr:histidine kinase [Ferruginibacter sp.]
MSRKQLWITYGILCFLTIWGWGFIDSLKFKGTIDWSEVISPFHFTQFIYIFTTFGLTRYFLKKYYPQKKYASLLLSLVLLMAVFISLRYVLEEVLFPLFFGYRNYPKNVNPVYYALDNIYYALVYIVLGTIVFFLDHQLSSQKNEAQLKQERINAELAFLRSQVSPHFLFNSLNNIYSLSYKKSDNAPDAILKLSELTRYMLYEKQDQVLLEKEWGYIRNFISLQQLRYESPLNLQLSLKAEIDTIYIAPYLLIPFVENAFKHGDVHDKENPMIIGLECSEEEVIFKVKNKIVFQQKDKDGGIGLGNVRRRLELLYPGSHQLIINEQKENFDICLKIKLSHAAKNRSSR